MKKIFYISFCLFLIAEFASAQQVHQFTQYTLNKFAFNPAVAGTNTSDIVTKANYRRQWQGFDSQVPTTISVSAHGNFSKKKQIGLGLMVFNDQAGPLNNTGIQLAYAYHIPIDRRSNTYLSFGIGGMFMQRNFNTNEFVLFDKDDPVADFANDSQWKGDAHFGLHLYSNNYWLSLSSLQLIQSEFNFSNQATATDLTTLSNARHFYGMGGYRFNEIISEDVDLEPSVLIKYVQGAPVSFEGTVRAFYQDQYWLGLNYRTEDAFGIMLGIELERGLNIAYSYDFITSQISNYSSGSHEITLGYDFNWRGDGPRKVQPFDNSRRKL